VGLFSMAKDRLIETMALRLLNRSLLEPYGQARELRINTANHAAEIVLELRGEDVPLHVRIDRYETFEQEGRTFVVVHAISTSREWVTALAARRLVGRPFPLPRELSGVLAKLV
jgi:hypothetical protein